MSNILSSGISALVTFQTALDTTSHNISNVNTEGYTRQRVDFETRGANLTGAGYVGNGVRSSGITRVYSEFLTKQVVSTTSDYAEADAYYSYSVLADTYVSDSSLSMSTAMQSFFNAVDEVADDPTSVAARQVLLSEGESLATSFETLNERFNSLRDQSNTALSTTVDDINSIAQSIADVNQQIIVATGRSGGDPPNDLYDERDQLVKQLAEKVEVKTVDQDDGSLNVFIGNGQTLVIGSTPSTLAVANSSLDPNEKAILFTSGSGVSVDITNNIQGGALGGLLSFQEEVLTPAQNNLGRIAVQLAADFNAIHEAGYDLNGNTGISFFTEPSVALSKTPTSTGDISVAYADPSALTNSNYQLDYDGTDYTLTRLSDDTKTVISPGFPGTPVTIDGITISETTTIASGDSFLIRPTATAASQISMAITDSNQIAAAQSDTSSGSVGDNSNALLLASLENSKNMLGGTASFQDAYSQLVAGVGTLTSSAEINLDAQDSLNTQAIQAREALSGVNLDEEAADLVAYQQAYQASARLITVAQELFDTLISTFR